MSGDACIIESELEELKKIAETRHLCYFMVESFESNMRRLLRQAKWLEAYMSGQTQDFMLPEIEFGGETLIVATREEKTFDLSQFKLDLAGRVLMSKHFFENIVGMMLAKKCRLTKLETSISDIPLETDEFLHLDTETESLCD